MTILQSMTKRMKTISMVAVLALVAGCSSVPTQPVEVAEAKKSSLDGDLLYDLLAAEFAGNAGDFDSSVEFYRQAALKSDDSRIAARAAYIAMYNKQYEHALTLLERWRELAPEDSDVNQMYALSYLHMSRPMEAVPYVQAILAQGDLSNKQKAMVVKQLLGSEIEAKDSVVLLDALNKAQLDNTQMLILQARYTAQLQQFDDSIALLDRVIEIDGSLLDVHLVKSRIYQAQGKRAAAKAVIAQVLEDNADNIALRMQYANMLVEDKEYEMAREQYLILKKYQPENAEVLLNLALLYIETDQMGEAAELLGALIELDEKTDIAHYYLGRIEQGNEQYKSAIAHYIKVVNGTYVFEAKLRVAGLFAILERVDEAIEQLNVLAEETEEWSNKVRVYLAQGEIFRNNQRYKDAFDMYSGALRFNREDINLLYARALIAEKVDRVDVAESDLLKVLSMDPTNSDALNALGYTLADKTERYQEAKEYIQKAAALVPDDPAIMDSLGWVSYRLGEMQAALEWLSKAFEKLVDAEIAAHYGEVLWQNNQKEKAREVWQKGQDVDAQHPVLIETLKKFNP